MCLCQVMEVPLKVCRSPLLKFRKHLTSLVEAESLTGWPSGRFHTTVRNTSTNSAAESRASWGVVGSGHIIVMLGPSMVSSWLGPCPLTLLPLTGVRLLVLSPRILGGISKPSNSCEVKCNDPSKKKKKKKKKKKGKNKKTKKKLSHRKTREFFGDHQVSRTHAKRRPHHAQPSAHDFQNLSEYLQRKKRKKIREREISDKRRRVSNFSNEPLNHPKTDTKQSVTTTRRIPNESTITQGACCAFS